MKIYEHLYPSSYGLNSIITVLLQGCIWHWIAHEGWYVIKPKPKDYYFTPWKFFTPALAGGLSQESEWQQVSSGLQDSSQYSSQSKKKRCSLVGLDSSFHLVGLLFGFYGISNFVGYLTPNPFLYKESVLFQTIRFSMSTQFNCQKQFYFKLFSLFKQL